jgi:hypothetical protein
MPLMTPLAASNCGTDLYVTGHLVHLVVVIYVIMTYHTVVNHDTTLSITCLQILHTMLIPISGMDPPPPVTMGLPPEAVPA